MTRRFPEEFLWGASTSAHQVEGGTENDWTAWEQKNADRLAQAAKKRLNGDNRLHCGSPDWQQIKEQATSPENYISSTACDHYNRYEQDFDLAADLHHNAHRFSIEWSRVQPAPDTFDKEAIQHYRDVLNALHDRNIEPIVTLWHFTHPQWFSANGGWTSQDAAQQFQDYVSTVVDELGDLVTYWITINEPHVYAANTCFGEWPVTGRSGVRGYLQRLKHLARAHRQAYHTIEHTTSDAQVGVAKSIENYIPYQDRPLNRLVAKAVDRWWNNRFLFTVQNELDFIGVNHYTQKVIHRARNVGAPEATSDMGWGLSPSAMYDTLMEMKQYGKPILVTENGLADADDTRRTWYIHHVLKNVHQAVQDGAPVNGYLHWSLMDNFEWDKGFWPQFGLVEVDYDTFQRTPRNSAHRYADIIQNNAL